MLYSIGDLWDDVFAYVVLAGLSVGVAYVCHTMIPNLYFRFVICILILTVVYAVLNWIFKPTIIKEVYALISRKIQR